MHRLHYKLAPALLLLGLAGCQYVPPEISQYDGSGFLGKLIDRPQPQVGVIVGDPRIPRLTGTPQSVPDFALDKVVGESLKDWLTVDERQNLAWASEQAATNPTGAVIEWRSTDGTGAITATGSATAVADVYRSTRGDMCRNVRQQLDKDGHWHAQLVTLCRNSQNVDIALWLRTSAE
jgi:hypothetical protein